MREKEVSARAQRIMRLMIIAMTFCSSICLCLWNEFYLDEWFCVIFLDLIFLSVFLFQIEYDFKYTSRNGGTPIEYPKLVFGYVCCSVMITTFYYLPEFYKPILLVCLLMTACSNEMIAVSVSFYSCMMVCISGTENYYELLAYMFMSFLGCALAKVLYEKEFRLRVSLILFCISIALPGIFYYLTYQNIVQNLFLYGAGVGAIAFLMGMILFRKRPVFVEEEDEFLEDIEEPADLEFASVEEILSEEYERVRELKTYSIVEYSHSKNASELARKAAQVIQADETICAGAAFYYRMGKWVGEPHVENGTKRARMLGFPLPIQEILAEYGGEQKVPSSKESVLVHMVDAIILKKELMDSSPNLYKNNYENMIYRTLNELSTSGIYDQSGMSIDEFLKIREFFKKELL